MKKALRPLITSGADSRTITSWNGIDAIAIGVKSTDAGPHVVDSAVSKSLETKLDLDFSLELSLWPEFTGKAGEIIELPVSAHDGINRIYLVGVGLESIDELRKAGAQLGRKTKGSGFAVLDGIALSNTVVVAHALAASLSQYEWTLATKKKSKPVCKFIFLDSFKE